MVVLIILRIRAATPTLSCNILITQRVDNIKSITKNTNVNLIICSTPPQVLGVNPTTHNVTSSSALITLTESTVMGIARSATGSPNGMQVRSPLPSTYQRLHNVCEHVSPQLNKYKADATTDYPRWN